MDFIYAVNSRSSRLIRYTLFLELLRMGDEDQQSRRIRDSAGKRHWTPFTFAIYTPLELNPTRKREVSAESQGRGDGKAPAGAAALSGRDSASRARPRQKFQSRSHGFGR